jgi:hypothetical protein
MFPRDSKQEEAEVVLAMVNPPADEDPALQQAIDTLALRAIVSAFDPVQVRDWLYGVSQQDIEVVAQRIDSLRGEMRPPIQVVGAALKLLRERNL